MNVITAVETVIIKELGKDGNLFTIKKFAANENIAITQGNIRVVPIAFIDCNNNTKVLFEGLTIWRPKNDEICPAITITAAAEVKPNNINENF